MKKLMIAFAALVCAVAANAATVNWQSGTVYIASDAAGTTGSGTTYKANASSRLVDAYLFALTATDYATVSSMSALDIYDTYIAGGKEATLTGKTSSLGAIKITQTVADAAGDVYGLLIMVDTETAKLYDGVDAFVKTATAVVDVGGSSTYAASNMATQQANWSAVTQSVPEPTSGLLLLIGMAGLALKRKVA